MQALAILNREVIACRRCPRLVEYREQVARTKRRAYQSWEYWGRPVPGFGDPKARLLLVGLAPGAHGANRTGRIFTGDSSGDFLYRALYETGFASQPSSVSRDDGLTLHDAFISASVRCAPPGNKPLPQEIRNCRPYLEHELQLLGNLGVVVALGRLAFDVYLSILLDQGKIARRSPFPFAHGRQYRTTPDSPLLIASYHPSQQNTFTGKLTQPMLQSVFRKARRLIEAGVSPAVTHNK
ncbi:MAG TPA: uracil-DNA glycosylase [Bryobacteraceae bacterium]